MTYCASGNSSDYWQEKAITRKPHIPQYCPSFDDARPQSDILAETATEMAGLQESCEGVRGAEPHKTKVKLAFTGRIVEVGIVSCPGIQQEKITTNMVRYKTLAN